MPQLDPLTHVFAGRDRQYRELDPLLHHQLAALLRAQIERLHGQLVVQEQV